jgi:NADP-dependent 3-hydroxy acid dehydrogenase YdfG/acyl carrier protein
LATSSADWRPRHDERTYLITGGFGALGLQVAGWLVERGVRQLVLVGRHGPSVEQEATWLEPLRRAGTSVRCVACDVADAEAVQALVAQIQVSSAPLAGVIHAAGVLDDGLLTDLDWERFVTVMAPKVQGAWNLHLATLDVPLDLFVLFSSAAGVVGSMGQGSYAAANAWLDGLARYRRHLRRPALSVQWGPWQEGMAARVRPEVLARWAREGVQPLTSRRALAHLAAALQDDSGVVGVWQAVAPAPAAVPVRAKLRQELAQLPRAARFERLLSHLQVVVGAAMGQDRNAPISPEASLFDLGVDSLMAVEIRNRLQVELEQTIPATALFEHPTSASLGKFLLSELYPEPKAAPSAAHDVRELNAALEDLEGLDEQGMAALLWSELRAGESE